MALWTRYDPPKPPSEACVILLDVSAVLPPGVGLTSAAVAGYVNANPAVPTADLAFGAVSVKGRRAWCSVAGGTEGTDYQLRWNLTDSAGNSWPRTVLWLCSETS